MEEKIYEILTKAYGTVYEAVSKEEVENGKTNSSEGIDMAVGYFKNNPSSTNYNLLKTAMLTYQYWMQKRVIEHENV